MINVIVVPEIEDFTLDVTYGEVIYINPNLGTPNLEGRNAKYIAPFWLTEKFQGVNRIYHINHTYVDQNIFTISLGNSFVLPANWDGMGSHRRFEYHELSRFGMRELQSGILVPL